MKNPKLYITINNLNQANRIYSLIVNFDISLIRIPEVKILTEASLNSLNLRFYRLQFANKFKDKKISLKPHELAALRIMANGINLAALAESEPYLWLFYNQLFNGDNDRFIRSC